MRSRALEQAWVGFTGSTPWRRFRSSTVVRRVTESTPLERADVERRRLLARAAAARHPDLFAHVDTVCLFVGHVKSGGTLAGAMLDAHPDAVVADEVDVLEHLDVGFTRDELFHVFARNARREAMKGRITARRLDGGYSVAVPGQWQGRHRVVRVIGESRAGPTTRRLGEDASGVERLRAVAASSRLRFVHVARNPLDPIAVMVVRGGRSVEAATDDYAAQAERVERIRADLTSDEIRTVHYDDLVTQPEEELGRLLDHVGLDRDTGHLAACARVVDAERAPERVGVVWTDAQLDRVRRVVNRHDFLRRYRDQIIVGTPAGGTP